jgi:hypothetical protein
MDHNILNKQTIEMILTFYVQLKLPIGCYKEFNRKNITWSNFS